MSEPEDSAAGRQRRADVRIKINLKYPDRETFVARFSQNLSRTGIFIRASDPAPVGSRIHFEYRLRDESRILRGVGIVRWARRADDTAKSDQPPGMGLEFIDLDPQSDELIHEIVARHGEGSRAPQRRKKQLAAPLPTPAAGAGPALSLADASLDPEEEDALDALLGGTDAFAETSEAAPIGADLEEDASGDVATESDEEMDLKLPVGIEITPELDAEAEVEQETGAESADGFALDIEATDAEVEPADEAEADIDIADVALESEDEADVDIVADIAIESEDEADIDLADVAVESEDEADVDVGLEAQDEAEVDIEVASEPPEIESDSGIDDVEVGVSVGGETAPGATLEIEAGLEIEIEAEVEPEAGVQIEPEAGVQIEPEAGVDLETEAETAGESELETEADVDVDVDTEAELETEAEIEIETLAAPAGGDEFGDETTAVVVGVTAPPVRPQVPDDSILAEFDDIDDEDPPRRVPSGDQALVGLAAADEEALADFDDGFGEVAGDDDWVMDVSGGALVAAPLKGDLQAKEIKLAAVDGRLVVSDEGTPVRNLIGWAGRPWPSAYALAAARQNGITLADTEEQVVMSLGGLTVPVWDAVDALIDQAAASFSSPPPATVHVIVPSSTSEAVRDMLHDRLAAFGVTKVNLVPDALALLAGAGIRLDAGHWALVVVVATSETRVVLVRGPGEVVTTHAAPDLGLVDTDTALTERCVTLFLREHELDVEDDPSLRADLRRQVTELRRSGTTTWEITIAGATITVSPEMLDRWTLAWRERIAITCEALLSTHGGELAAPSAVVLSTEEPAWADLAATLTDLLGAETLVALPGHAGRRRGIG